ncbi:MAG: DUF4132 domain-containing protein [Thermoanaerobaculia bacterium]|nr:DUF4132 domain-containing protein [Thermoanaerobaculia bacterium]
MIEAYPQTTGWARDVVLKETTAGKALLARSPEENAIWVTSAVEVLLSVDGRSASGRKLEYDKALGSAQHQSRVLESTVAQLLRRKLPFDAEGLRALVLWITDGGRWYYYPYSGVIGALERFEAEEPLPKALEEDVIRLLAVVSEKDRRLHDRLLTVLGHTKPLPIQPGEAWTDAVLDFIDSLEVKKRSVWVELLDHCGSAKAGKPSKRWAKVAAGLVEQIGQERFLSSLSDWLPLIDRPRTQRIESWSQWVPDPNFMLTDTGADVLKGLIWSTAGSAHPEIARAVSIAAVSAYKKVPGVGPRATKVGNACVWALGEMSGDAAIGALALLKLRVKFGTAQKGIDKALQSVAERTGIAREDLEEIGVPTYGLERVGLRCEQFGDFTAELEVKGTTGTELRWKKPDGKYQKSIPKAVKDEYPADLKEIRQAANDIKKMLPAQRDRIDSLYLASKRWQAATWRERYLDHPLVGTLARRLIWWFGPDGHRVPALWHEGGMQDVEGRPVSEPGEGEESIELWHPIQSSTEEVLAWRDRLAELEVQQPFKQAHREIYLLTDAERNTETYSNRYASHIIKQHQFSALCAARGWKYQLRLMVDDSYRPAYLELPQWNLRAEFWVEGAGDEYGVDTNEAGTYLYLATDQVRFYASHSAQNWAHAGGGGYSSEGTDRVENHPIPVAEIPQLVLTEVLRDVDLFVGVASVGNDPNWSDGGREGRYLDYWNSYSFGALSETAQTRKAVLEKLIPRLNIAERCELTDRFLQVRGDVRTYKIHLGSSNILMEPNDQYLCIVASQSSSRSGGGLLLPFEGDNRLAMIISKALLLAADRKITDRTILSQIKR